MEETVSNMLDAGEVLSEVEWLGPTTLRRLAAQLDWPVPRIKMATKLLVRQGLVRLTEQAPETTIEPQPVWPSMTAAG